MTNWVAAFKSERPNSLNDSMHTEGFFRARSLVRDLRFALASLSPLFAYNTKTITPPL